MVYRFFRHYHTYHTKQPKRLTLKCCFSTNINLKERSTEAIWQAIKEQIIQDLREGLVNSTGSIMAIEGLNKPRQNDLFNSYIPQNEGAKMLPEEIEKHFFEKASSNTNRKTKKYNRKKNRTTRKRAK